MNAKVLFDSTTVVAHSKSRVSLAILIPCQVVAFSLHPNKKDASPGLGVGCVYCAVAPSKHCNCALRSPDSCNGYSEMVERTKAKQKYVRPQKQAIEWIIQFD
jgi:hypothetical protein